MRKLEELIQQYCPDGVDYRPIWSLTAWDKKFNGIDKSKQKKVIKYNYLLAADLKSYQVEGGSVKLLTTNISNLYTTEELAEDLASDGEVVAIPWGGNPVVQYYKGRFLTADNRIATSLDTTLLNNKFLYYCMLNQMKLIASFYRGSGIKHPEMAKVLDLEIPVPPLPIQEEVVRILDNFTELQAELQAELQKRLQQYNYYRDYLLSFEGRTDIEWKKIKEVVKSLTTGLNPRQTFKLNIAGATYPYITGKDIFNNSINPSSKTDKISFDVIERINKRAKLEDDMLLFASTGTGTVGRMAYIQKYSKDWSISETLYAIKTKSLLNTRFLMYYLTTEMAIGQYRGKISKGSVPHLKIADLMNVVIPIPSTEEQHRVVELISHFDILVNDINTGLPAEIEARRKQYEYYRNQLLTFKQKA